MSVICAVCKSEYDPDGEGGYYGATCSKECARIAQLQQTLNWIAETVRELLLNQAVPR